MQYRYDMRLLLVCFAACAHHATPTTESAKLDWMVGAWHADEEDARIVQVAGVTYLIALRDPTFSVAVIEGHGIDLIEHAKDGMHFEMSRAVSNDVQFGPMKIARTGDHLALADRNFSVAPVVTAPELDTADRAFAADSKARGADAWVAIMASEGALWQQGHRVEGDAIHEVIAKRLTNGTLVWSPSASGVRGDLGFTVGSYALDKATGTYCTIWKREAGVWKVLFDLGT